MTVRRAWLAGSLPAATPQEAIELVLTSPIAPHLLFLPAGETDRPNWAGTITQQLARSGLFDILKEGDYSDYDHLLRLTPVGDLSKLNLGYYERYTAESEIAQRLCQTYHYALTFQVGIVSPFDQSMIAVGPGRHLRYHSAFIQATLRDVMKIYLHDESVIFQIEAPYELCGALKAPRMARSIVTSRMVRQITDFVSLCPPGMRIGIHPCLGDLNHQAIVTLDTLAPLVDWVNELCDTWPRGYILAYVQLPLCAGQVPPITDPGWSTDLKRLRVPGSTRIILGLCHEHAVVEELRPVVTLADTLLHRTFDVGASCGLALRGGRTLDDVHTVLTQQAELCR